MNAPKLFAQGTICNSIPLLTDEIAFYDDIFLAGVRNNDYNNFQMKHILMFSINKSPGLNCINIIVVLQLVKHFLSN